MWQHWTTYLGAPRAHYEVQPPALTTKHLLTIMKAKPHQNIGKNNLINRQSSLRNRHQSNTMVY